MVANKSPVARQVVTCTSQYNTKNQSFIDMYHWLRFKGVKNCEFFLALYDTDLMNIDPRDPNLSLFYKRKVLAECMRNFWYFLREVVRIPVEGGEVGGGAMYKLTRANLALNYGFILNWNMFLEQPRQTGKSISTICYYLWQFLFFSRNADMLFLNKKLDDSKLNLQRLKDIRAALPDYLRLDAIYNKDGTKKRGSSSVVSLVNPVNNNCIKTAPAARNKMAAQSLARGMTVQFIWYDEYGFIPYNYIIYQSAAPAFSRASKNAQLNGGNYGILITTTPGDMLNPEGREAYDTKEMATKFSEMWYDMTPKELNDLKTANPKSNFIYIRYTYRELGYTEEYFDEMCRILKSDWPSIRREVLLEWSESAENSPFEKSDLDAIKKLVKRPIRQMWIGKPIYTFDVFKDGKFYKYPPIIGVDVAGGLMQDSSAITIVDTETTEVLATFNSNYIAPVELARVIYLLVKKYMPNGVINIERNGVGNTVVTTLLRDFPDIKPNLYWEVKDKVVQESYDKYGKPVRATKKVRAFGLDQTPNTRRKLTEEILMDRIRYHKDKIHSERIYTELSMLEITKKGRIDHPVNGHDDQVMSWLIALYVWYEGQNLMENWHIRKTELETDDDFEMDEHIYKESELVNIGMELATDIDENSDIAQTIKEMTKKVITQSEFMAQQEKADQKAIDDLLRRDPLARKAYEAKYHETYECDEFGTVSMLDTINEYYSDGSKEISPLQKQFNSITNLR